MSARIISLQPKRVAVPPCRMPPARFALHFHPVLTVLQAKHIAARSGLQLCCRAGSRVVAHQA